MGILSKANQINENASHHEKAAPRESAEAKVSEAPRTPGPDVGTELEKVRDLLFGSQLREQQASVESRLQESLEDLRTTVERKIQSFQDSFTSKVDKMASRVDTEATQRLSGYNVLEEKLQKIQETLDARLAEHKEWIETTVKAVEDRIAKRDESVRAELATQRRTDRQAFSKLLTEMSRQMDEDSAA